jgi:16S rRNA (adenine1518-N6/adenine1519-N6)-dimethyltransferase
MDLTSAKTIKELLVKYNAKPSKGLGQNFLIDKNILNKIIEAAELKKDETVMEVGPGIGVLTQELARRTNKVIAIEKDETMIEILGETLSEFKNVNVINEDVLKFKSPEVKDYKVVANIPYYLTSPLIRKFLEMNPQDGGPPKEIILMIQKEVAQRICAKPPQMSLLAVSVQFYAKPEIISYVSKNCFLPAPKVDSAIIKITPNKNGGEQVSPDLFFKIVKAGFSSARKQLVNNLTTLKDINSVKLDKVKISHWLLENDIKPNQRAETLTIPDWINLTKSLK